MCKKNKQNGIGLGLTIVQKLINKIGPKQQI